MMTQTANQTDPAHLPHCSSVKQRGIVSQIGLPGGTVRSVGK